MNTLAMLMPYILQLSEQVLADLKGDKSVPAEIIQQVQSAYDAWQAVKDSPVTFAQLESIRSQKTF